MSSQGFQVEQGLTPTESGAIGAGSTSHIPPTTGVMASREG
jgi:hypothetical protein